MAETTTDHGDQFHEGGVIIKVEDEDLYIDELEAALDDFDFEEIILVDFEGEEDFYQ